MSSEPLIILGDFNIRMDLPHAACLSTTHELGHTLDLIITLTPDNIIAACPSIGELFSNHFPVSCQIRSDRPQANVTHVQFRKMKSIDPNQFSEAIPSSQLNHDPPNDLDSLVSCYNEPLRSQLDMYALVLTRDINVRPLAAWFKEDIRNAKRLRRNAEKKWRATRLPVDLAAFKKERNRVVNLMNETRRVYYKQFDVNYNQFIEDNSKDQRRLFTASKSLLNMKKDRSLPHIRFHCLQTIWVSFLLPTLPVSGQSWTESLLSTPEPNLESESGDIVFSHFQCQTTETVRHMITSGKNKSCILDPIPASLSSACLDSLLPIITNIINLFLQTGYFTETWQTAVVYTSFNKPDFDLLFKNFRLISNSRFVFKFTERVVASQIQCHMITKISFFNCNLLIAPISFRRLHC